MQLTEKQKNELFALVRKYEEGKATPQEAAFVEAYYDYFDKEEKILNGLSEQQKEDFQSSLYKNIFSQEEKQNSLMLCYIRKNVWRFTAAAAIILIAVAISIFMTYQPTSPLPDNLVNQEIGVKPGSNKAVLTIVGGKKIILDSRTQGVINKAGGLTVQNHEGTLSYSGNADNTPVAYNTITIPRGGQYRLELSDGTHVWLNSGSSLHYPTTFNGKERAVELTGEGYFEVVHNSHQPFKVTVNGHIVQDIGTAFNINAYADETAIRTTLVTGAIRIGGTVLKPGQEAVINGGEIRVEKADIEHTLAWKSGLFNFDGADLPTVLRALGRWYNIPVRYEGAVPQRHFGGEVSMELNLSEVLRFLEMLNVHFRMENGTLIVSGAKE